MNVSKTKTMIVSRSCTMHPHSPPLTVGGTVLKESDLVILGVTFDSKMTFEKHLHSVSQAAAQRLGVLRKSLRVFDDRTLLVSCFCGFVLLIWCTVLLVVHGCRYTFKLLYRAVSGAWFLTAGAFECDIAHHGSLAVLHMLYKIRCNPMHPLNGALPGLYVPVRVTRGALVAHQFTSASPCCRTLQYHKTYVPFSVPLWNNRADPIFDDVGLVGFKSWANAFLLA